MKYKPHKGQRKLHFPDKPDASYFVNICGRRYGKTTAAFREAEFYAAQPNKKIWLVGLSYKKFILFMQKFIKQRTKLINFYLGFLILIGLLLNISIPSSSTIFGTKKSFFGIQKNFLGTKNIYLFYLFNVFFHQFINRLFHYITPPRISSNASLIISFFDIFQNSFNIIHFICKLVVIYFHIF